MHDFFRVAFFSALWLVVSSSAALANALLPSTISWSGESEKYIKPLSHPWITVAEKSHFTETPSYEQTVNWLKKMSEKHAALQLVTIGESTAGRKIVMAIITEKGVISLSNINHQKPTLLFHGGIHSGEIDGKDAGMMLIRDLLLSSPDILKNINLLFIPVLNVDGHELVRGINRVNQRGPDKMGWRTNSKNLNLNRDFTKLDSPEVAALITVINQANPDLYIDVHVTDGIDYQSDITYGFNRHHAYSPNISNWLSRTFRAEVDKSLSDMGHIPAPLIFAMNNRDLTQGISEWTASPRYSNGYGDARHLASILVENHSLKPYKQRVLGTYVFLQSAMHTLIKGFGELRAAQQRDSHQRKDKITLSWKPSKKALRQEAFAGMKYQTYESPISGIEEVKWLGKPQHYDVDVFGMEPHVQASSPQAYWIPSSRRDIIEKLRVHGISHRLLKQSVTKKLKYRKLEEYTFGQVPFEGRMRVEVKAVSWLEREVTYLPGSAIVETTPKQAILTALLLEPQSSDSWLSWGYFNEIFQRTEYIEGYVIAPLAERMMKEKPELKAAFEQALKDEMFRNNPRARLQWFYERSPFYDPDHRVYPIGYQF